MGKSSSHLSWPPQTHDVQLIHRIVKPTAPAPPGLVEEPVLRVTPDLPHIKSWLVKWNRCVSSHESNLRSAPDLWGGALSVKQKQLTANSLLTPKAWRRDYTENMEPILCGYPHPTYCLSRLSNRLPGLRRMVQKKYIHQPGLGSSWQLLLW